MTTTAAPTADVRLRRGALGVVLFAVLACIYLLLYRGHPLSIDEISMFDSVGSLTQHGTLARTTEFYRAPALDADGAPFLQPLYEPMQIIAAAPFYLLVHGTGELGQFHAVFLLNIVVTALTGVSLYAIALRQGYATTTAWLGGFLFGTATLALPYSRWFFREPLAALFALWAFAAAYEARRRLRQHAPVAATAAVLVASTLALILTKQAGVLFVPGLLVCLILPLERGRRSLAVVLALLGAVGLFLLIVALVNPDFGDDRYLLARWLDPANLGLGHMAESALGYQISPARSIWLYSPLLLLGLAGMMRLLRGEARWLVAGIVITVVVSSAAYGALRLGGYWSGGWTWGPRYMLPVVPLLMLCVLPVIEALRRATRWQQLAFAGVAAVSAAIQLLGIAVPFTDFYNTHYPRMSPGCGWLPENWAWQNTAIGYHLQRFSLADIDSAWRFADPPAVVPLVLLALLAAALAFGWSVVRTRRVSARRVAAGSAALLVLTAVSAWMGLVSLRDDGRYVGNRQDVHALVNQMNALVRRGDTVFLSGSEYMLQFMNWFKAGAYVITLPDDATMTPSAGALEPAADPATRGALDWAAARDGDIWLVRSPSAYAPDHPQFYRRILSAAAFASGRIAVSPFADAERFATGDGGAQDMTFERPAVFGGLLALEHAALPGGHTLDPGDTLTLALRWMPVDPIGQDITVSVQVIDASGTLVAQRDSMPQNGFARTSSWQQGESYDDRHGVPLPDGLPAGEYQVAIVVYDPATLDRLPAATGDGALLLTHVRLR